MPIILFESGPQEGQQVHLAPGDSLLFGRDPQAPVPLNDEKASRAHFRIKEHKGRYFLKDLNSTNGTRVNQELVHEHVCLEYEDRIQVGSTVAVYLPDDEETVTDAALIEALATGTETQEEQAALPAQDDPLVGRTLGGYEILAVEGRGGMGTVYRANQLSLHREVALKVLSEEMTRDETFVRLFQQEARAAGQLNHPNIVQVYDVGQEDNLYFYSMEYLPRGSVEALLTENGQLSVEEATAIVLDAARGLVFAEKKKLVHRDIKPENLMIGEDGIIKIADLGLAKSLAEGSGKAGQEGILGTPHFISPEQARGLEVDTRSDLYSLGASFYRMVSGRTPFSARRVKEIVRAQIHDTPPPVQDMAPEVPDDVAAVIARLMEKDPADRFPTAEELVTSLEAIQRIHHYGRQSGLPRAVVLSAVVLGVAALAVALVLTRGNGDSVTRIPVPGPMVERPQPDLTREQQALLTAQAEVAYQAAALQETSEGLSPSVMETYREIARQYPDTDSGKAAWRKVGEIETYLQEQEQKEQAEEARIGSTLTRIQKVVEERVSADRFGEALAAWSEFEGKALLEGSSVAGPKYAALEDQVLGATRKYWQGKEATVQKALLDQDILLALSLVDELDSGGWLGDGAVPEELASYPGKVDDLRQRAFQRRDELERQLYDEDRDRFLASFKATEALLARLDFAAAARVLNNVPEQMKTAAYRDLSRQWQLALTSAHHTFDACVRGLKTASQSGDSTLRFLLPGDAPRARPALLTDIGSIGVTLVRTVSRQQVPQKLTWAELSESGLDLLFQLLRTAVDRGAASEPALAQIAILLGQVDRARALITEAGTGPEGPIQVFLEHELEAERIYRIAVDQFQAKEFGPALDSLDLLASRFAGSRAYLARSDGSSYLVKRAHLYGGSED